jgi:hypothetical protein
LEKGFVYKLQGVLTTLILFLLLYNIWGWVV